MRPLRWILTLVLAALVLTGCSLTDGASDSGEVTDQGGAPADGGGAADRAESGDAGATGTDSAADDVEEATAGRAVITTGSMTLVVDDAAAATDEAVRIVEEAGGRVDERSEQGTVGGDGPSAWLTVRVPSADLTATLDRLEALGEAQDVTISSQDVTRQTRDLDARITALQTSVDRLLSLMADAESSEALIAAENALSERQAELESLQSERAYLADQVALSTLHLSLVTESAPQLEADGFLGGLADGWNGLVTFAGGLMVVVGILLPWLVVLGIPAALAVVVLRRRRRARRADDDGGEEVRPA